MIQSRRWCKRCGEYRLSARPPAKTFAGALAVVVTCGLLLPFYVLHELGVGRPWRCQTCGGKV